MGRLEEEKEVTSVAGDNLTKLPFQHPGVRRRRYCPVELNRKLLKTDSNRTLGITPIMWECNIYDVFERKSLLFGF